MTIIEILISCKGFNSKFLIKITPFFIILLLASCAPRITLLVSPEAQGLGQLIQAQAKGVKGLENLQVQSDGMWPKTGAVARLTSTPGWNLPSSAPDSTPWPQSQTPSGYQPYYGLIASARASATSWRFLPLFYDPIGVSRAFQQGKQPPLPAWGKLSEPQWKNQLVLSGRQPLFHQALFFLSNPDLALSMPEGFLTPTTAWKAQLNTVSSWLTSSCWLPSTWQFAPADLKPLFTASSPLVFVTTYRHFIAQSSQFPQSFQLWYNPKPALMVAQVLSLEVFTPEAQDKTVYPLVNLLTSSTFGNLAGMKTHWIPVNQNTYEIDSYTAAFRKVASQAPHWVQLSNRIPPTLHSALAYDALEIAVSFAKKK